MSSGNSNWNYLIVRPENGGLRDLFRFAALGNDQIGFKFLETGSSVVSARGVIDDDDDDDDLDPAWRWVLTVSIVASKIIKFLGKPMEWFGLVFDFVLNLLFLNGNLFGLFKNLLRGQVVIPARGSETYISTIGHLDGRFNLYKSNNVAEGLRAELGNRALMDLCIMAAKLAYENANVVQNIVNLRWKMHFVDFYNCWNDYQNELSTQVFIFMDKPEDANLILVSFRGTEPFVANDWITDFDYSWYKIHHLGRVHMGFMEALGLGNRKAHSTFQYLLQTGKEQPEDSELLPEMTKKSAYYAVRSKLKILLNQNKNAKFVVTGHSLGGALAILFPVILSFQKEDELMERLLAVYTFGQPRVGDRKLGEFMDRKINYPVQRYFRVVYCNDLVPRLPYDNKTFLYKHFGLCLYYSSCYTEQRMQEQPNPNFFGWRYIIPEHLNAAWELIRSFMMRKLYGPDYTESWCSTLMRLGGLVLPGISAHCPTDYVNSMRLGREQVVHMTQGSQLMIN